MERSDRLWIEGKFLCCDCQEEIDDSRKVDTPFGEEICEICAVKCFICDNKFRYDDIIVVNGDNICSECREHLFVICDENYNTYLLDPGDDTSTWNADRSEIKLFDSRIEAQEIIDLFLSGHTRYQIQKL